MPKPLSEFTLDDWKHLRPLTQALKTRRYRAINARYVQARARSGDPAAIAGLVRNRNVLVTVAFKDAQVIAWQLRLLRRYVPHDVHLIADNTQDDAQAEAIRAVALREGASYIRLPENVAKESRSHGLALNWIWHNILRPGAPSAFGFLDHDLFPLAPDDPFAVLKRQDFYGWVRTAPPRWFLWAGFCFFRFDAVKDKSLDFGQDWFVGLDTGGGNWNALYHGADLARFEMAAMRHTPYRAGVALHDAPFQWIGDWLHEVGVWGRDDLKADKRRVLAETIAPHLRESGSV